MKLASIISDGAVFQRGQKIAVFGEGTGEFSAKFLGEERSVTANGKFCVEFSAHEAGGPYEMYVNLAGEEKIIKDIMIGEVILLAGQSNPELTIADTFDKDTEFLRNHNVRFYMQTRPHQDNHGSELYPERCIFNENWSELKENEARSWSAIALHTALYFEKKLGVAVGVVAAYKGSTIIQSFLSEKSLGNFEIEISKMREYPLFFLWNKDSCIYHYVIEKLIPYQFGSVIWYQGESNRTLYEAAFYDKMLETLIADWRVYFQKPDLPFAIVEINDFPEPCEDGVKAIQEALGRAVAATENTELVVIKDLGEHALIHPRNKREVSERICAALEKLCERFNV
ncbi:MAG: hypothetical protein KBS52_01125 [Clostridiales bacterium]|nr:hypothetical protein [Candidatus Equinaster intestinalis]